MLTLFVNWKINKTIRFFGVSGGVQYIIFQYNVGDAISGELPDTHWYK